MFKLNIVICCILVAPSLANPTLQGLLASPVSLSPGSHQLINPDGIQIIAVTHPTELLGLQPDSTGRTWHVIHPDMAQIIAVAPDSMELPKQDQLGNYKSLL